MATTDEDVDSAWYIRRWRRLSQPRLADMLGMPITTLRKWEQNLEMMEPATIALMRILASVPEAALRPVRRHAA